MSDTGNVTLFKSPWGMEHIRVINGPGNNLYVDSQSLEGFHVCRWDPNGGWIGDGGWAEYYDYGNYYPAEGRIGWNAGWNAPYKIEQPNGTKSAEDFIGKLMMEYLN